MCIKDGYFCINWWHFNGLICKGDWIEIKGKLKMDTLNILTFKSEPEEEAGKKSKLTCVSDFQIFIVLYFAFEVYTMNLSKSVVITIFHLFELLNAENIFLYICLLKVLRNNALCFSSHSQLSVVSKTLNKQFGYF